jgi:hypothetical protein
MSGIVRQPCDEGVMISGGVAAPVTPAARPWILAATIVASGMAFIDGTVVNVALPDLQTSLGASAVDAQWIVESYVHFYTEAQDLVTTSLAQIVSSDRSHPVRANLCRIVDTGFREDLF